MRINLVRINQLSLGNCSFKLRLVQRKSKSMEFNALSIAIPISIFEAMDRGIPCSTVEPPPAYSIAVASVHIIAAENLAGVHSGKIKRSQISVQLMQPNGKIVPDTKHRFVWTIVISCLLKFEIFCCLKSVFLNCNH